MLGKNKILKQAEKIVKDFFKKATIDADFDISEEKKENEIMILVKVKTQDPQALIGRRGLVLSDAQLLLGKILRHKLKEQIYFYLDVNGYKESKIMFLKDLAKELANKAKLENKEQIFPTMTSFERRIIHTEIANMGGLITESQGEGDSRRVVVKPA